MGTGNEKVESKPMPVGGYVKNNAGSPDTGHSASGVGAPKPGTPAPGAPTPSTTKPGEHGATKPVVPATTKPAEHGAAIPLGPITAKPAETSKGKPGVPAAAPKNGNGHFGGMAQPSPVTLPEEVDGQSRQHP